MGFPLYVIRHFSLVAFNIFLCLIFVNLITMCFAVFLVGFILPGILCLLYLVDYFISHVLEFSTIISSNIFSGPFSLSSTSGTSIMQILVHLMLFHRSHVQITCQSSYSGFKWEAQVSPIETTEQHFRKRETRREGKKGDEV